jgi:hypothetical protein
MPHFRADRSAASAFYWIPRKDGAVFPSYRAAKNPAFSSIIRLARSVESFNKRPCEIPYCIRVARSDAAAFERFRPRSDRLTAKRTRAEQGSSDARSDAYSKCIFPLLLAIVTLEAREDYADIARDPQKGMCMHPVIKMLDQNEILLPACKIELSKAGGPRDVPVAWIINTSTDKISLLRYAHIEYEV